VSTPVQRQKKTLIAAEQDTQRVKDLRFAYRLWSFTIDPRNLVFIDETGIHLAMTRLYGRAPVGERLYDSEAPDDGGKNISLIGGMSLDGLIATLSIVGSVNTDVFLFYIQEILIPQLWVGAIVVMDNLPVHHATVVTEAIVHILTASAGSSHKLRHPNLTQLRQGNFIGLNRSNSSKLDRR
jgi:hypothetical protein